MWVNCETSELDRMRLQVQLFQDQGRFCFIWFGILVFANVSAQGQICSVLPATDCLKVTSLYLDVRTWSFEPLQSGHLPQSISEASRGSSAPWAGVANTRLWRCDVLADAGHESLPMPVG